MALLNDKSRVFKRDYRSLVLKMRRLLERMEEDSLIQSNIEMPRITNYSSVSDGNFSKSMEVCIVEETEEPKKIAEPTEKKIPESDSIQTKRDSSCCLAQKIEEETPTPKDEVTHSKESSCSLKKEEENAIVEVKCESTATSSLWNRQEESDSIQTKRDSSCCLAQKIQQTSIGPVSALPEAFLGSFLASLVYLQKGQEGTSTSSAEKTPLKDSIFPMLGDISQPVNQAERKEFDKKDSRQLSLAEQKEKMEDLDNFNGASCPNGPSSPKPTLESEQSEIKKVSCLYRGKTAPTKWVVCEEETVTYKSGGSSQEVQEITSETTSEGESDFEEAVSRPFTPSTPYDLRPKPSVTCMGDLSKVVTGKRSASTLTCASNITPSWIRNLSNEIRSKLKSNRTNVRVYEKQYAKCGKEVDQVTDALQFTISADTPVGVLDVTVVQNKRRRTLKGRLMKMNKARSHGTTDPNNNGGHFSGRLINFTDDASEWSDDSLWNYDSESIDFGSNSGEEMEEFLDVFVQDSKKDPQRKETAPTVEKGFLVKMDLLDGISHFFEIQKCCPVYFMQEIERKNVELKENPTEKLDEKMIALPSGSKQEKQVVISGSSSDLVIYIQVEVEDDAGRHPEDIVLEYKTIIPEKQKAIAKPEPEKNVIKLKEGHLSGESLYKVWDDPQKSEKMASDKMKPIEGLANDKRIGLLNEESKEKSPSSSGLLSEAYIEREIQETVLEEPKVMETARIIELRLSKQHADVWLQQNNIFTVQRFETRTPLIFPKVSQEIINSINTSNAELQKALALIREIENNIVDVNLGDAISILPQLDLELRKHLEVKMKTLPEKKESEYFFSVLEFLPAERFLSSSSSISSERENSKDRLKNLLKMLSDLEEAVKMNVCSSDESCGYNPSKIYELLHSLVINIREIEANPSYKSLSQTLEMASELDTAVREYEMMKNVSLGNNSVREEEKKKKKKRRTKNTRSLDVAVEKEYLQDIRKNVFKNAEERAVAIEQQIEKIFGRLDRLEMENDEALNFLEVFLKKSERRVSELETIKSKLLKLSESLKVMLEKFKKQKELKESRKIRLEMKRVSKIKCQTKPVKETLSGLFHTIDDLKSVAKEKNEIRKEIFSDKDTESYDSARTSLTTKNSDQLTGGLKEFKKVGETSLYLAWYKPDDDLDSILGYQIYVNEKLNQKVRNPKRLQAVLYAVDLMQKNKIDLYAVTKSGKVLLATVDYDGEL